MAKLLLVEDNEMNRDMLSRRLARRGFDVEVAVDGGEALEKVENQPDLILLDMSLPVIDGWTLAGRIKGREDLQHIPVIALTAHAMVGDREKALAAGCDEYEAKPVDFARLLGKISSLLDSGI